ncbi:MAG TPA: helix-turn-helix domain-containing protein [Acidimicrobiia bacterium]|nr:helix-turn-helix domain-containing protein [Acidimicrobiia bacterium]
MARTGEGLDLALARVGDRWALRVVDALLAGPRRFTELQHDLGDVATNVLSQRLKQLEQAGVLVARPYSTRPLRNAYELTAAGRELAGALALLADWGARQGDAGESPHHDACGSALEARWYCPTCERVVDDPGDEPLRYA